MNRIKMKGILFRRLFEIEMSIDILRLQFASLPQIDSELIELAKKMKNEKRKPLDEPKSKYINRPIKNYRR